jgi:hypothetical protein
VVAVQNPLTSLADDVAATKRAIALQDGPVLLVGHSYGGVVITEAGNDPKVVGLVYVAALAPSDGESVASVTKPFPPAPLGSEVRADAAGFLTVTPKGIAEDFAQDLPDKEKQVLTASGPRVSISAGIPAGVRGVRDDSGGSAPDPEDSQIGSGIDCCVDDCRNSQSHFRVGIWLVLCRCSHGDGTRCHLCLVGTQALPLGRFRKCGDGCLQRHKKMDTSN